MGSFGYRSDLLGLGRYARNLSLLAMLFAVYGSLRVGEFNYDFLRESYGPEGLVPIVKGQIKGYHLYSLGEFPAAIKQEHAKGIRVDIIAASKEVTRFINGMEIAAGYTPRQATWGHHHLTFYVMEGSPKDYWPLVPDGDWSKYLKARKERMNKYAEGLQD